MIIIKELRKKKGLTQKQLAEKLGMTSDTLRRIELGEQSIKLNILPLLAEEFGEEAAYLMVIAEIKKQRVI